MIYKVLVYNCYFHKIENRYISFCSFLASISPGGSANFSCSPRESSGVVFSFKTLTSFFRPSTSLLRILCSASDSVCLCSSFFILSDSVITPWPLFILSNSSELPLLSQRSQIAFSSKGANSVVCPDSDCSSCFCLPCMKG